MNIANHSLKFNNADKHAFRIRRIWPFKICREQLLERTEAAAAAESERALVGAEVV
jgi:hypothetical protein